MENLSVILSLVVSALALLASSAYAIATIVKVVRDKKSNRPVVDVKVKTFRAADVFQVAFELENTGRKMARNVNVEINQDFLGIFNSFEPSDELYNRLSDFVKAKFSLGIGQIALTTICRAGSQKNLPKADVIVTYQDDKGKEFQGKFSFELASYIGLSIDLHDLSCIARNIEKIEKNLRSVSQAISKITTGKPVDEGANS